MPKTIQSAKSMVQRPSPPVLKQPGVKRVVYLGGVVPQKKGGESRHLRSRRETGETLRKLGPSTVELRAAMIVGQGSASWIMVRDLAARLPAMILPRWLRNVSYPVSIYDVVTALVESLTLRTKRQQLFRASWPRRVDS